MIEFDTALIILMVEALAALLLLGVILLIVFSRRRSREHAAAHDLVVRLEKSEVKRSKKLGEAIIECCEIDKDKLREILKEISSCEHALYQQILQIFLKRDVALLNQIDSYINKLSSPYCRLLKDSNSTEVVSNDEELEEAKLQISRLKKEGAQLSEQLEMAMKTMDEISAEYTRVFSGTQSELELENSSKKMLRIFHEAEKTIRSSMKGLDEVGEKS